MKPNRNKMCVKLHYSIIDFSMHKTTISSVLKKLIIQSWEYCKVQLEKFWGAPTQ